MRLEFAVLGPLEARANGELLPLGGAKQRALLAILLLSANRVVTRERLIDDLWGDAPPEGAVANVQVHVSRLRKLLPEGTLLTRSPGYVLNVEPLALDLERFEQLVEEARTEEPRRKSALLREALSLWRGPPLADLETEPFHDATAGHLAELRLAALEDVLEAELALGRHAEVTAELAALIGEHPHRVRLRSQLALALYRSGRHAEALEAVRAARAGLDELGLEPTESLRLLERRILTQDDVLEADVDRPLIRLDTPTPSQLAPKPWSPFVGRSGELELLGELLARAERGFGGVVLLRGEAGGGKTRLARQLAQEAAGRGALVLYGASDPVVRTPYQALQEWLEIVVDLCEPDALRPLLRDGGGDLLGRIVPRLASLAEPRGTGDEHDLLPTAAARLLVGIARSVPLVVIADDIQWADAESLHLLRRLARAASGCRMVLVAVLRDPGEERSRDLDELVGDLMRLDGVSRISLDGLSSADVRELIRASAHVEATEALVAALAELTDGTPLLVCELWRDLLERDAVSIARGRADLAVPLPEIRGPEQVRDIVRQRVGRLHEPTTAMLEVAAVAAAQVDLRVLRHASDLEPAALVAAVDEAVGAGIVEELPGARPGIRFVHELVRRALYDRLSGLRRAELHGHFGRALEAVHASDVTPVVADLAHHFTQAVPVLGPEPAVAYNRRAADAAAASVAFDDAIARLTTALELGVPEAQRRAAQVQLAYLLHEAGHAEEADALLAPSIASSTALVQRGEAARVRLFSIGAQMGDPNVDPADMRASAEEAVATFAALGDEHGLSHAHRSLATALRRQGRLAECCGAAERALVHAELSDDPAQRRRPIGTLCYGLCDGPTPVSDALARCEELLASARGDRLFHAVVTWGIAALLAMEGRADEAREQIERTLPVFDEVGQMLTIRVYRILVAEAMELIGDLDGAEQQLRVKWRLFRDLGRWEPDARAMHAAYHLGHLYCDQGRWKESGPCLEYGSDIAVPEYFRHESVLRLALVARVEAQRGRVDESTALAQRATVLADLSDFSNLRARTWLARAEVEERCGRAAQARTSRGFAAELYRAKGNVAALRRIDSGDASGDRTSVRP